MATVAHALTTKEKVKEQAGITGTTVDDMLDSLINSATDFIEYVCGGRRFKRTTYTNKLFDARGGDKLFFPQYPVTSVSALEYRTGTWGSPSFVAFNTNDYLLYTDEGYIHFGWKLPESKQYFRVTYVAGFLIDFGAELDTTKHTLPFDICQAATELVMSMYQRRLSQGKISESVEGQSITWATAMSDDQKAIFNKYRTRYGF